jgi:hypothetical protein
MSPSASPRWKPPAALVAAVICLCLALIIERISHLVPLAVAGQAYLLLIILLGFRYWPPMARWVARMPAAHRIVFALLIGSMIAGHFSLQTRTYFPYVSWEIFPFVREDNPVTCREFQATTVAGKQVRLLVEQLFPSIVQFDPPRDNDGPAMGHLVQALARAYNRGHADDPVQRIDLVLLGVKLHPSASESRDPPSCELLKSYDISSAPSN